MPCARVVFVNGSPSDELLREAAACTASGGALIFPTETVYGIGCDPQNEKAVAAVFKAKGRSADKPLAIHLARPEDARDFADSLSPVAQALIERLWPGPVAIVVARRKSRADAASCGGATVSLRCPADAVCAAILRATGPLAATSANTSGKQPFTGLEPVDSLPEATLAIISGPTRLRKESSVVDCSTDTARIVREGAVDAATIRRAISGVGRLA